MPKTKYSEAPLHMRQRIEAIASSYSRIGDRTVLAAGWLPALDAAARQEIWIEPSDIPTPGRKALADAEASGDAVTVAQVRRAHALDLYYERAALARAEGLRAWAAEPNAVERAAAAKEKRDAQAREDAIDAKARDIVAAEAAEQSAKALAKARTRAAKELN